MNGPSFFFLIAAAVAVMFLIPGASSIPKTLTDGRIAATGENVTDFLIVDSAPEGLSGYNVKLSIMDPLLFEITSITFPPWASDMSGEYTDPDGRKILVRANDVSDSVTAGSTEIPLTMITVRGPARVIRRWCLPD
jgi:hypothetical protein